MKLKLNIDKSIFYLSVIFSLTIILQGIPMLENINKVMMIGIIGLLFFKVITSKQKIKNSIVLILTCMVYILALIFTEESVNMNTYFYFILWILYFIFLNDNYNKMMDYANNNVKFIKVILYIWSALVLISFFIKKSYIRGFFSPFGCGEHRFGSSCLMITALNYILVLKTGKRRYFIFSILPIIGIAMGGARTYLAVYLVMLMCLFYLNCKKKWMFYVMLIPAVFLLSYFILNSPIGNKFEDTYSNGYNGFWATFTSGRSNFWKYDLQAFFKLPILQQFVGNGFDFVYSVNLKYINMKIFAHNDFINLLMNFGYIGMFLYEYVFFRFCKKNIGNISRVQKYSFYFIWFFNAFFNMVYTYPMATLVLPYILYSLKHNYNDNLIKGVKIYDKK